MISISILEISSLVYTILVKRSGALGPSRDVEYVRIVVLYCTVDTNAQAERNGLSTQHLDPSLLRLSSPGAKEIIVDDVMSMSFIVFLSFK